MRVILLLSLTLLEAAASFAGISVKKVGDLVSSLHETSGLEFYKGKYLISHNDSGDEPRIFLISNEGEIQRTIQILNAKNQDWEDITSAPDGRLFVADIGNNLNKRTQNQIYIIEDGFAESNSDQVTAKTINFSYEDQKLFPPAEENWNYDAEAIFWMNDSLYILTKCHTDPYTGRSFVYVIPDKEGDYKAKKIADIPFCSTGWMFCSVTAADYHPESNTLVVLLYGKLVLLKNFKGTNFLSGSVEFHNLRGIKQREAITFIDGNSWFMSDERKRGFGGGNLYRIRSK